MGKPSVIDEIKALIPQRGTRRWYERVDTDQAQLLEQIMAGWIAGEFGTARRTASQVISKWLQERGIAIGEQGVDAWLKRAGK